MKRIMVMMIAALFIISAWDMSMVLAELNSVTIQGASTVQAGKVYEYSVTVNATGFNFVSNVTSSGAFDAVSVGCDASGSSNVSLSSTVKITVTVKADALPGDKGTIQVSGTGCSIDEKSNPVNEFAISKTLEVTVAAAPVIAPKPTSGSKPKATPTPTPTPSPTPTATPTPEPSEWELAILQIESMPEGGTLTISMSDSNMTSAALAALQEKQGTLILDFGSYSCTIDGSALGDVANPPMDLGMTMVKDEAFSEAVSGKDIYQLHFAHSGDLPGTFLFTFRAAENQPGDRVYLYYFYDASHVVEGVQSSVVDADGYVTFGIYHCSSYFVSSDLMEGASGIFVLPDLDPATVTAPPLAASSSEDTLVFGVGALIAVFFGTAVLAVFAVLFVYRVGIFKKKDETPTEAAETTEATEPAETSEPAED